MPILLPPLHVGGRILLSGLRPCSLRCPVALSSQAPDAKRWKEPGPRPLTCLLRQWPHFKRKAGPGQVLPGALAIYGDIHTSSGSNWRKRQSRQEGGSCVTHGSRWAVGVSPWHYVRTQQSRAPRRQQQTQADSLLFGRACYCTKLRPDEVENPRDRPHECPQTQMSPWPESMSREG